MLSSHPGGQAAQTEQQQSSTRSIFRFGPRDVTRAISFHLLDTGLATQVKRKSVKRTIARLNRTIACLAIPRDEWIAMTDPQRLQWLLEESGTAVEVTDEGTAVLRAEL